MGLLGGVPQGIHADHSAQARRQRKPFPQQLLLFTLAGIDVLLFTSDLLTVKKTFSATTSVVTCIQTVGEHVFRR